jgi:hypothetical protein
MSRVLTALTALVTLTAFAPAPFPRPARRENTAEMSLRHLQGRWRIVRFEEMNNGRRVRREDDAVPFVRVEGERWSYLHKDGAVNNSFPVAVNSGRGAVAIDWFTPGPRRMDMFGLVRRQGDTVQIVATSGRESVAARRRPSSFDHLAPDWWVMTLKRED